MAILKKDGIVFSNGRQIKVAGGILSVTRTLEIADYYSRNVLFFNPEYKKNKETEPVGNIYNLSKDELIEIADCMIQLWISLKDNARKYGVKDPDIFKIRQ